MAIQIRPMAAEDLKRIGEIDRSERVSTGYRYRDGELRKVDVDWLIPRWTDKAEGEFNLEHRISVLEARVQRGELPFAAFDEEQLVGYVVLRPQLTGNMAQLSELFVDRKYRRKGVASGLLAEIVEHARESGHSLLYVSSVPSRSAVRFYQSRGFRPTDEPHPELLQLEPDDIHMTMPI